jgi:hypothetical protein
MPELCADAGFRIARFNCDLPKAVPLSVFDNPPHPRQLPTEALVVSTGPIVGAIKSESIYLHVYPLISLLLNHRLTAYCLMTETAVYIQPSQKFSINVNRAPTNGRKIRLATQFTPNPIVIFVHASTIAPRLVCPRPWSG